MNNQTLLQILLCLPDDISPEHFLAEYWQKKPLLIRQGLPQLTGMFEPEDILGLALEPDATSRLITHNPASNHNKWKVKQSPLDQSDFNELPDLWTVLVQNLEQWSFELGALWQAFEFIPQWQRDDIMVSYAPKGGSVGMHYDDYDVFLAQGFGSRRWQLGIYCDENTAFVPDEPIRLLEDMSIGDNKELLFDEVLHPGDALYVPPKLSHYGVALDDSLTFSFGFRRPNLMQVLDSLVDVATSETSWFVPFMLDQTLHTSGQLNPNSIQQIKSKLIEALQADRNDSLITQAIAETVSRRQYDILTPDESIDIDELHNYLQSGAVLRIDYSSKLIYIPDAQSKTPKGIYANGQRLDGLGYAESQLLKRLADGDKLTKHDLFEGEYPVNINTVMTWLENGWIWLDAI